MISLAPREEVTRMLIDWSGGDRGIARRVRAPRVDKRDRVRDSGISYRCFSDQAEGDED